MYEAVQPEPGLRWDERKCAQNQRLFAAHPDQVWVLDRDGDVFGYVTFWILPERHYGHIDNNAVRADAAGQGWATFMYRRVLDHFRELGLRYAHVDTGLDDAHVAARRAYEAVGFDRQVPTVDYWQDLGRRNPGSGSDD
jgi:ribosomal protein S18 acetylase RimI-like enzyme